MIITSVMMIIIDVAGNVRGQYNVDGTADQGQLQGQLTIPHLDYVYTFPLGLLIPGLIYRVAAKDSDEASCQSVGDNDGANDPGGYPKVSIREYAQIERQYGQLR